MYGNFCADYMPVNGDAIFQLGLMEYELVSLVIHQGTLDYGHYFAYHRSGSKSWFCINDEKVSQVAFTSSHKGCVQFLALLCKASIIDTTSASQTCIYCNYHYIIIITDFMERNFLKLNPSKTVFLPISRSSPHTKYLPLRLNDSTVISPSQHTRNLGITFDCNLNFRKHISTLRRSCFYELKRLSTIRNFLPRGSFETVIHSYVTSKLDFCNILFNGLPDIDVNSIKSIINACAKTVTRAKKYDSASLQLKTLHWLPIVQRAKFKALPLSHKLGHNDIDIPYFYIVIPILNIYMILD